MEEEKGLVVQNNEVMAPEVFGVTIEQARKSINNSIEMYKLAQEVITTLLNGNDMYYMSELSWPHKRKAGEMPVINKQGIDKLISFFKIETFPTEEKVDGGYKVTVVGRDKNGNYIATGTGICTKYEKKYMWIKADDEEYAAAGEDDRRIVQRTGKGNKKYDVKQIRTDERSIAHTLISMATKRARSAFLKMALCLSDVSFEGEEPQTDYGSSKTNSMSKKDIKAWYKRLEDQYGKDNLKNATIKITGDEKVGDMNLDTSQAIEDELKANAKDEADSKTENDQ